MAALCDQRREKQTTAATAVPCQLLPSYLCCEVGLAGGPSQSAQAAGREQLTRTNGAPPALQDGDADKAAAGDGTGAADKLQCAAAAVQLCARPGPWRHRCEKQFLDLQMRPSVLQCSGCWTARVARRLHHALGYRAGAAGAGDAVRHRGALPACACCRPRSSRAVRGLCPWHAHADSARRVGQGIAPAKANAEAAQAAAKKKADDEAAAGEDDSKFDEFMVRQR